MASKVTKSKSKSKPTANGKPVPTDHAAAAAKACDDLKEYLLGVKPAAAVAEHGGKPADALEITVPLKCKTIECEQIIVRIGDKGHSVKIDPSGITLIDFFDNERAHLYLSKDAYEVGMSVFDSAHELEASMIVRQDCMEAEICVGTLYATENDVRMVASGDMTFEPQLRIERKNKFATFTPRSTHHIETELDEDAKATLKFARDGKAVEL